MSQAKESGKMSNDGQECHLDILPRHETAFETSLHPDSLVSFSPTN